MLILGLPSVIRRGLYTPLLNGLSSNTVVIGAWSMCRRLASGVLYPMAVATAGGVGGGNTAVNIGFDTKGRTNFTEILQDWSTYNNAGAATIGLACTTGQGNLFDQSSNANHLSSNNGFNQLGCSIILPGGKPNTPVRIFDGTSLPTASVGYNGYGTGSGQPYLSTAQLTSGNMAVSFGATSSWWGIMALRPRAISVTGRLIGYQHTGDGSDTGSTTSFGFTGVNGLSTMSVEGQANSLTLSSKGNLACGQMHVVGFVVNGSTWTSWVDGTPGTSSAYAKTLGAGGAFHIGGSSGPWQGDFAECLVGTTIGADDWSAIMSNMCSFYKVPLG